MCQIGHSCTFVNTNLQYIYIRCSSYNQSVTLWHVQKEAMHVILTVVLQRLPGRRKCVADDGNWGHLLSVRFIFPLLGSFVVLTAWVSCLPKLLFGEMFDTLLCKIIKWGTMYRDDLYVINNYLFRLCVCRNIKSVDAIWGSLGTQN